MAEKPTYGTPAARLPSLKRPRGTPTFETPHRPRKRAPLREIAAQEGKEAPLRRLSFVTAGSPRQGTWSDEEFYSATALE